MNRTLLVAVFTVLVFPLVKAKSSERGTAQKPSFKVPGRRISESKCLEYNWARKNLEKCSEEPVNIDHPCMAILGYKEDGKTGWQFKCSACLISPRFLLTTGRCLRNRPERKFTGPYLARLGNRNVRDEVPRIDVTVLKSMAYPEKKNGLPEYDIGLVELATPVELSRNILPACLWSRFILQNITEGITPGWIAHGPRPTDVPILKERKLQVMDTEDCEAFLKDNSYGVTTDLNICTNGTELKTCWGTAGNPLLTQHKVDGEDSMPHVFGMASFALDCSGGSKRLFTRVSSYIEWIEGHVWPNADAV